MGPKLRRKVRRTFQQQAGGEQPPARLEPLYTIDEIAKAIKRSRASLYRDIAAKRLVATKINGATRFTRQNFNRYVGANQ